MADEENMMSNKKLSMSSRRILSMFSSLLHSFVAQHERLLISSTMDDLCLFSATSKVRFWRIETIFKKFYYNPSVFVVAYVYIHRLILNNPDFRLTSRSIHRLFIASVMVAAKFLGDLHYSNEYFGKVGRLTVKEMNNLEMKFLSMVEFRLQVTVSVFESYFSRFKDEATRNEVKKGRGRKRAHS